MRQTRVMSSCDIVGFFDKCVETGVVGLEPFGCISVHLLPPDLTNVQNRSVMTSEENRKKLMEEVCCLIGRQASFWKNTNDIKSPTHICDIEEEVNMLETLTDEESEELTSLLCRLYGFVSSIGGKGL